MTDAAPPERCPNPATRLVKLTMRSPTVNVVCDNCSFHKELHTLVEALDASREHMLGQVDVPDPAAAERASLSVLGMDDARAYACYSESWRRQVGWLRWWLQPEYVAVARLAFTARVRAPQRRSPVRSGP